MNSPQLTVFTPAPVIAAESRKVAILGILAGKAQADAGDCISTRLWNLGSALGAMSQARTLGHTTLRAADRILDRRVYLVLYSTFFRPACSHTSPANIVPGLTLALWEVTAQFKNASPAERTLHRFRPRNGGARSAAALGSMAVFALLHCKPRPGKASATASRPE